MHLDLNNTWLPGGRVWNFKFAPWGANQACMVGGSGLQYMLLHNTPYHISALLTLKPSVWQICTTFCTYLQKGLVNTSSLPLKIPVLPPSQIGIEYLVYIYIPPILFNTRDIYTYIYIYIFCRGFIYST